MSTITSLTEADMGRGDQSCQQTHHLQRLIWGGEIWMSTITPLTEADMGRRDQGGQHSHPFQRLIQGGEIRGVNSHTPYRGRYREGRSGVSTITPLTEADTGRGDCGCQQAHSLQRLIWGGEIRGVNIHTPY